LKTIPWLILIVAGVILTVVAMRTSAPDYLPPALEEPEAAAAAPDVLTDPVPAGYAVRTFEVEGMCCLGCTGKLHAALVALPDVSQAAVGFARKTASAVVPEDFDLASLEAALIAVDADKYRVALRP